MAEGFARAHGRGVLIAKSAGLNPCEMISPVTAELMRERGITLDGSPKGLDETGMNFDLILNMSGMPLAGPPSVQVRQWPVEDPIWFTEEKHRAVRDQIEGLVLGLIEELRRRRTR